MHMDFVFRLGSKGKGLRFMEGRPFLSNDGVVGDDGLLLFKQSAFAFLRTQCFPEGLSSSGCASLRV